MEDYLAQELSFLPDRVEVKHSGIPVMMSWELPLMRRMAEIAAMRRGDVLEVGFGMGLSCNEVQKLNPRSHTIVEAHPQIIERARKWAASKPSVEIVAGRWQDVIDGLGPFDGISFDVFAGHQQRIDFFSRLRELLRPRGVATLWLGDERELPPSLEKILREQRFRWHLTKVTAVPSADCTYSSTNEFYVPIIFRDGG